jgi:hemolysin III
MRARAGRWLAGGIARSHLDAGVVRHRAQTSVDGRPRWLSVGIYLAMGWLAVIAAAAIFRAIPTGGIAWILGGGLVYSAGALIYGLRRPNLVPGIFGFHELWHFFVMAGSACHFWVMLRYIAPIS